MSRSGGGDIDQLEQRAQPGVCPSLLHTIPCGSHDAEPEIIVVVDHEKAGCDRAGAGRGDPDGILFARIQVRHTLGMGNVDAGTVIVVDGDGGVGPGCRRC